MESSTCFRWCVSDQNARSSLPWWISNLCTGIVVLIQMCFINWGDHPGLQWRPLPLHPCFSAASRQGTSFCDSENSSQEPPNREAHVWASSSFQHLWLRLTGISWDILENLRPGSLFQLLPDLSGILQKLWSALGTEDSLHPLALQRVQPGYPEAVWSARGLVDSSILDSQEKAD